jgi:hypothetical protein
VSERTAPEPATFARLMAGRGLSVEDVALECGVHPTAVYDWRRGGVYPSERYAGHMVVLFGKVDARALYAEREARKGEAREDRRGGRALRAAARVLEQRGLHDLARRVERAAGVDDEQREGAAA